MLLLTLDHLNPLENKIYDTLTRNKRATFSGISSAAELCNVSISKISKFVKKVGFNSYKDFSLHLSKVGPQNFEKNELDRISHFLEGFDNQIVEGFASYIEKYEKIVLFGYGPTYICLEYFEYKLRLYVEKNIISLSNESLIDPLLNQNTLVIIFSTTGRFSDFDSIFKSVKRNNAKSLIVLEEYNKTFDLKKTDILYLTSTTQDSSLNPYEKSRSLFFIFIEEVIRWIADKKK